MPSFLRRDPVQRQSLAMLVLLSSSTFFQEKETDSFTSFSKVWKQRSKIARMKECVSSEQMMYGKVRRVRNERERSTEKDRREREEEAEVSREINCH